jgi:hypothetical protein
MIRPVNRVSVKTDVVDSHGGLSFGSNPTILCINWRKSQKHETEYSVKTKMVACRSVCDIWLQLAVLNPSPPSALCKALC